MNVNTRLTEQSAATAPGFRLKGGLFPLTLLELTHTDLQQLRNELSAKVAAAPDFFQQAPTVLSLENLSGTESAPDLAAIKELCQEFGLLIIALRGADDRLQERAKELNLAILANSRAKAEREIDTDSDSDAADSPVAPEAAPANATAAKIITSPVRSGQQIYAADCDLIVLAPVSAGAELLADGNIHVYGPLRGRALAGVKGNTQARIFCQSQEAELISIAGYFKLNEDLREAHWQQPVQAFLTDETLNLEPLTTRTK